VLVDGPSKDAPVPRQQVALAKLSLTPIVISKLPRATGVGHVAKRWEDSKVDQQFNDSAWAKKRAAMQKRRGLNDFERFKVMKMRKQVCACIGHPYATRTTRLTGRAGSLRGPEDLREDPRQRQGISTFAVVGRHDVVWALRADDGEA
jgi:ribosomal protein L14E/L6E/L27E